jgi:hypothetical protein
MIKVERRSCISRMLAFLLLYHLVCLALEALQLCAVHMLFSGNAWTKM